MLINKIKILICFVIVSIYSTSFADPWGTYLGTYNSVNVYSNGTGGYVSNEYNFINGTNTGMKWQCVEYVNRYYLLIYNKNIRVPGHNAVNYYPNATQHGLVSYPNNGNTAPAIGDVLCFSGGNPNYGHVAIVREIGSNYLKVAQQNVLNNSGDVNYNIIMSISNGYYNVSGSSIGGGYVCQGWLRKTTNTVSVSFKFNGIELPSPPIEYWKLWKYPPLPSNFYTLTVTITNKPPEPWDLWLYRPNGDSVHAALNVSNDVLIQPFNVSTTNSWFPNSGNYKFKVMNRTNPPTPRTIWSVSQPFYISSVPILTVGTIPGTIYVGQPATFSWNITGGIPTLPQGGWTNNIQIQWYHYDTAKNVLGTPLANSNTFPFIVPSSNGGPIPGTNYRLSGSNPPGSSIPPGYIFAFTNYFNISYLTGIEPVSELIPLTYKLYENYPNPFNPTTNIKLDIPKVSNVKLTVFDILGKEITTLINEDLKAGSYEVDWDGSDYPSGVYFYKLIAGDFVNVKKMVLLK